MKWLEASALVVSWLAVGGLAALVANEGWRWNFGENENTEFLAGLIMAGPFGLLLVAEASLDAWKFWKNGRKSQHEVIQESIRDISQAVASFSFTTAQAASAFKMLSQALEEAPEPPVEEAWTPEPVLAWRWWTLNIERLALVGNVSEWQSGIVEAAHVGHFSIWQTERHAEPHTKAPHPGCLCGVNALKVGEVYEYAKRLFDPITRLFRQPTDPIHVVGRVALSGVVDEYEKGYRAEKAQIIELVVLSDAPVFNVPGVLDALAERYGVMPTVQSRESWLAEMEVIHGYGKEDQADHLGAGADSSGAASGTGQGASQNRVSPLGHINFQTLRLHHLVDGEDKDDGLSGVTDA